MATTLLTGLPRAGTTLFCALLNDLSNVVALVEPMSPPAHSNPGQAVIDIGVYVAELRRSLFEEGVAPSKIVDGQVVTNTLEPPNRDRRLRQSVAKVGQLKIDKPLTADFHLFLKHPAFFTALAKRLSGTYELYAIIRDPLSVLASWQTVALPVNLGRAPVGERFDPLLGAFLDDFDETLKRQVALLSWYLRVYADLRSDKVLRYEDLLADPESTLLRLHSQAGRRTHELVPESLENRYAGIDFAVLANALKPLIPLVRKFYPEFEDRLSRYS